jgi:serine/threonine protein kinase
MDLKQMTSKNEIKGIEREVRVHFMLDSPRVIKLYDCFIENGSVYMILEWAKNGNLYSYLYRKKRLDETEAFKYFY